MNRFTALLTYQIRTAAVGEPLTSHLFATLERR